MELLKRILFVAGVALIFVVLALRSDAATLTTVTGKIQTPSGSALTSSTYVLFDLEYCGQNQPRIAGTAQLPSLELKLTLNRGIDSSGNISTSLYGNDQITCGVTLGGTRWRVTYVVAGNPGPVCDYNITGATWDLNTQVCSTVAPVVTPPTGDTTYLRLDAGNSPVTGAPNFLGGLSSKTVNAILFPDQYSGGSVQARINAAFTALGSSQGMLLYASSLGGGYTSNSPVPANASFIDLRTGTSASPITSAISKSPNFYMTRYDNTQSYTQQGDNIVGGFNTWGSLMRLEGTSNPVVPAVGAFATLISTVNAGADPAPSFNVAGGDTRLAAYFGARRGAGIARGITSVNTVVECDDVETNVCSSIEADLNQRTADAGTTGVAYGIQVVSGGAQKATAGIGIVSSNAAVNAWHYGIVVGGYDTSGIIINPSTIVTSAHDLTLSGCAGCVSPLHIQNFDIAAETLIPRNDTDGLYRIAYKADGTTKVVGFWKRGAMTIYGASGYDGTAAINLPHGKCIGFESNAGGATLNGICSDVGDDGFALGTSAGVAIVGPLLANTSLRVGASGSTISDSRTLAQLPAALTTTAATSDNVSITGVTSSSHCFFSATNATAATNIATTYISAKTTNQITVTHAAISGMTYDIICTVN